MKKNGLFAAMLVMVLALGAVWVGCDSATDDGGGNNLVASEGTNKVGGKTYVVGSTKTEFSITSEGASNGRYKVLNVKYSYDNGYPQPVLKDGKYTYEEIGNGAYSWNETAKTVTLSPEKVMGPKFSGGYYPLCDKGALSASYKTWLDDYKEQMGEEVFNQQISIAGFSSAAAYLDYIVAESFANRVYNYAFSTDNAALFLDEVLPANKGTNELAGQTYNGVGSEDGNPIKDTTQKYVFTASGYTYTDTERSEDNSTGTYAYDSTRKAVWLKPSTVDRQARYDALSTNDDNSAYYASTAEYKAMRINGGYRIQQGSYDTADKTIR
jgi:hypothetical protein